jgi:hypothetical protein
MKKLVMAILPMAALAACGGEAPTKEAKAETPKTFPTGQWEVTGSVDSVVSKDGSTPAVQAKKGDPIKRSACISDPKKLEALFLAAGDTCTIQTEYARSGRINNAYQCKRPGVGGTIYPTVAGEYEGDSFEARTTTGTTLSGSGDYQMVEVMTGKRTGDCAAGDAPATAG